MKVRPISMLIPSESVRSDIDQHIENAKEELSQLHETGQLIAFQDRLYVYRITDQDQSYTGIVIGVDIGAFQTGQIVHHEKTMAVKVDKQAQIAESQGGFSKPILLTHDAIVDVNNLIQRLVQSKPQVEVFLKKYSAKHELWPVEADSEIDLIVNAYRDIGQAYIIDGHHRTAALQSLAENNPSGIKAGLCAFFPIDQLKILSFHRLLNLSPSFDGKAFLNYLKSQGSVSILKNPRLPSQTHEIIFIFNETAYRFQWDSAEGDVLLDVDFVSQNIFKAYFQIEKESDSADIKYLEGVHDVRSIKHRIVDGPTMAILLHPIRITDLMTITNSGRMLPPKSTYFLPRMANGIIGVRI